MFDVSIFELMVIGVVALIVIGPERLPRVARTAGHLLGRMQRYVNDVKADISREMQLEELKRLQQQVTEQTLLLQESLNKGVADLEQSLNQTARTLAPEESDGSVDVEAVPSSGGSVAASVEPLHSATEHKP